MKSLGHYPGYERVNVKSVVEVRSDRLWGGPMPCACFTFRVQQYLSPCKKLQFGPAEFLAHGIASSGAA